MIEQKRGLLWQRVFKGAMAQKYDQHPAEFGVLRHARLRRRCPEDQTGILSDIATPTINVYKTRVDLAKMQFVAADQVKDFTVLANVLSAGTLSGPASAVHVPGAAVELAKSWTCTPKKGQPRAITSLGTAFGSLQIACDEFLADHGDPDDPGTRCMT